MVITADKMLAARSLLTRARAAGLTGTLGARAVVAGGGCVAFAAYKKAHCAPAAAEAKAEEPAPPTLAQRCLAEAVGTAIIVQGGCGVVCAAKYAGSGATIFGIACGWGMSVALAVYATRAISGAHLNPAVTCALAATGKSPTEEAPPYILAQLVGATVAAAVNYACFAPGIAAFEASAGLVRGAAGSAASYAGAFAMVPNAALMGVGGALAAEVWMTGILVFLIMALTDADTGSVPDAAAPPLIGATVATLICTFGPVTGCGMNPARDLGPRLITLFAGWGTVAAEAAWVYTLGPVAGAILGATMYDQLFRGVAPKKEPA